MNIIENNASLPLYESQVSTAHNRPHIVSVRPINNGGINASELLTRERIASTLRTRIIDAIRVSTGWSLAETIRRTSGTLTALNLLEQNRGVSRATQTINEITEAAIEEMFVQMTQSADTLLIYQVEWSFVINPRIFLMGGSTQPIIPCWVPKRKTASWKTYSDQFGPISCAAIALCLASDGVDHKSRNYSGKNGEQRLLSDSRVLQTKMGWETNVGINELEKFVEIYPKFRLTCLMPAERNFLDYTFTGSEFEPVEAKEKFSSTKPSKYYLYIYLDLDQKHYVYVSAPLAFYRAKLNTRSAVFCHQCAKVFKDYQEHKCNNETIYEARNYKSTLCLKCGLHNCTECRYKTCKNCKAVYEKSGLNHRCIVMEIEKEDTGYNTGSNDGKKPSLWVYDLESKIEKKCISVLLDTHQIDSNGYYDFTDGFVKVLVTNEVNQQIPNLVYAVNVFTKETVSYFGDNCIHDFITFILNHNGGNSILLAHNAASYDSRLIFEDIIKRKNPLEVYPTMNGCKFNELRIGSKIFFRDSRNHLMGSVASLAKDFGCKLGKEVFPHLFNSVENYSYIGPLPGKEYYDLSFLKTEKDFDDFHSWYEFEKKLYCEEKPWNFRAKLFEYCKNDVDVLADIVLKYHEIYFEKFEISPWKSMTSSSYFHKVSKIQITRNLELPEPSDPLYELTINQHAHGKHWTVLKGPEYALARESLRGGRTGVGRVLTELTKEEIDRGCSIKYVDVVSLYPYHQVSHNFPVGIPTIHIFDTRYQPCYKHRNTLKTCCDCPIENRYSDQQNILKIKLETEQWSTARILNDSTFHGFVIASVTPPTNMLHPILVHFDDDQNKCNATCEPLIEQAFTTPEFIEALKQGYRLDRIHRFDRYQMAKPLWEDFVKSMYIFKLVNSRNIPEGEEQIHMINEYEENFEMGDEIRRTFSPNIWGNNKARKAAAKNGLNSGWGKHAQRPKLVKAQIINYNDEESRNQANTLFLNISKDRSTLKSGTALAEDYFMYKFIEDGDETETDLTNSYLPAACFVPSYGRLQLWEQLNKLGNRVIMYDTDSVTYIHDPKLYNPSTSKMWGQWEEEDISVVGITGVVCTGPKSYAMRCKNKDLNVVKLKGLSQTRATSKILNYDTIKKMVLTNIATNKPQTIQIPQTVFRYVVNQGIQTRKIFKKLSFDCNEQKGNVSRNMVVYPKGYDAADFIPL